MAKLTRILSIDGGGIRGIIPGQVLVSLEQKLRAASGNEKATLSDFFDLVAGTSTGGILACFYLCPDPHNAGRPKFPAQSALELYLTRGSEIFDASLWQKVRSGAGLLDEKYSAQGLEQNLEHFLGDTRLSDLLKPCLITAYNMQHGKTEFFTQHDAKDDEGQDYLIRDVARATSAAPSYFEAANISSLADEAGARVDGGLFANNPALCAYAEVRHKFKNSPSAKDMAILSLGTGHTKTTRSYAQIKDWGAVEWIIPLIDVMMVGTSETVDYQLRQIYDAVGKPQQYLRVADTLGDSINVQLDDASKKNLQALQEEGNRVANKFDEQLDAFMEYLL